MLLHRVISAAIGIPLLLWVTYLGGNVYAFAVGAIILLGIREYYNMIILKKLNPSKLILFMSAGLIVFATIIPNYSLPVLYLVLCMHLFAIVFKEASFQDVIISFFGVFYIAWTLGHLILIRDNSLQGFNFILLSFLITWSTDTGAYFTGRSLGKHKLSPSISPNKTIEGAVGGIFASIFATLAFNAFVGILSLHQVLLIGILGSITGQLGDLVESALKRWTGVKDSGQLIPGHGGVLDRFDSLILVSPLVYYYMTMFIIR